MTKCLNCNNEANGGNGKYKHLCAKCRAKEVGKLITETNNRKRLIDPDAIKKQSPRCLEYWLAKGFTLIESKKKLLSVYDNHSKKLKESWNKGDFDERLVPVQLEYWLAQGFSLLDAKKKQHERQITFSKEICIEKYGKVEGIKIWQDRQDKWQNSLKRNPNYNEIQKSKGLSLESCVKKYGKKKGIEYYSKVLKTRTSGYSKMSQELFWKIYDIFLTPDEKKHTYFYEHQKEFVKNKGKEIYLYDFVISNLNLCIEFHGDIWHANPNLFTEKSYIHPFDKNISYNDIHEKDRKKQKLIESFGFEYYVVWEYDYRKKPDSVLSNIKDIINESRKKVH